MSRVQKLLIIGMTVPLLLNLVIWQVLGGEVFTKTEVFITKTDELMGTTYREGVPGFVPGLDFFLVIAVIELVTLFFVLRMLNKKREQQ